MTTPEMTNHPQTTACHLHRQCYLELRCERCWTWGDLVLCPSFTVGWLGFWENTVTYTQKEMMRACYKYRYLYTFKLIAHEREYIICY